jgi:hypothetical protein
MSKIKTFRGLMVADTQDTIVLHTNTGSTGYRIVKFQIMGNTPGTAEVEAVVKIYKVSQSTNTSQIDFSDNTLLAAAEHREFAASEDFSSPQVIIFDNEIFNQDIFVTYKTAAGSMKMNYYIELEQISLDLSQNTVATLKDIRNIDQQ